MENITFSEALGLMKFKGPDYRASRDAKPGLIIWMKGEIVGNNMPIEYIDYVANDWRVFEDNTDIRE